MVIFYCVFDILINLLSIFDKFISLGVDCVLIVGMLW